MATPGVIPTIVAPPEVTVEDAVSLMLCSTVILLMALLYVLNFPNALVRFYARAIVGNTVAIFLGVLAFHKLESTMYTMVAVGGEEGHGHGEIVSVQDLSMAFLLMFLLLVVMEFVVAACSGMLVREVVVQSYMMTHPLVAHLQPAIGDTKAEFRERNANCFGGIVGHITAFSAIAAFGKLQQLGWFGTGPVPRFLVACIALAWFALVLHLARRLRMKLQKKPGFESAGNRWHATALEVENDAVSIALSFLLVTAFRNYVAVHVPSLAGSGSAAITTIDEDMAHRARGPFLMWIAGAYALSLLMLSLAHIFSHHEREKLMLPRVLIMGEQTCLCCASWASLMLSKMFIVRHKLFDDVESVNSRLAIAVGMSVQSFFVVAVLNIFVPAKRVHAVIRSVAEAASLAIGFAWEECYSCATGKVLALYTAERQYHGAFFSGRSTGLVVGAIVAFMLIAVVFAHRLYLVPFIDQAKKDFERSHQRTAGTVVPIVG